MDQQAYVFISYAHRDSQVILPCVEAMKQAGISVWYDEGIEAGSEWPEFIAQKVNGCSKFVLFISRAYLQSQNCKRELNFAISRKKDILSVFLEDVELSLGMEMQLGTYQALFRARYATTEEFYRSFCRERFFDACRGGGAAAMAESHVSADAVVGALQAADGDLARGATRYADGSLYGGKRKEDLPDGQGTMQYANGATYTGEWKNGNRHGQGVLTYADGTAYAGEWKDNERHGRGTLTWPGGTTYTGEWKSDKQHGQGVLTYSDGSSYAGEWKDGKRCGRGTMTWAGGTAYDGEWKDDKQHGRGTVKWPDGTSHTGLWQDGKQVD